MSIFHGADLWIVKNGITLWSSTFSSFLAWEGVLLGLYDRKVNMPQMAVVTVKHCNHKCDCMIFQCVQINLHPSLNTAVQYKGTASSLAMQIPRSWKMMTQEAGERMLVLLQQLLTQASYIITTVGPRTFISTSGTSLYQCLHYIACFSACKVYLIRLLFHPWQYFIWPKHNGSLSIYFISVLLSGLCTSSCVIAMLR